MGRWLAAAALALSGCGPWITTIPTYWSYEETERPDSEPQETAVAEEPAQTAEVDAAEEAAMPAPDAPQCTAIYVVTAQRGLFAFAPDERTFERRGTLRCPGPPWTTPFSMAVARSGVAHVVYSDGQLYEVDVVDASCEATPFEPSQPPGFRLFGMGYAADPDGPGEALYVAQIPRRRVPSKGLARIDTDSWELEHIGRFPDSPGTQMELTPTGDGPLYAYFLNEPGVGGTLARVDTETADILERKELPVGTRSSALAIAWWGGAHHLFTTFSGGTRVTRYDPEGEELAEVATLPEVVVGAGVSTCAPN